jgi:uncharacterized protein YpmS
MFSVFLKFFNFFTGIFFYTNYFLILKNGANDLLSQSIVEKQDKRQHSKKTTLSEIFHLYLEQAHEKELDYRVERC